MEQNLSPHSCHGYTLLTMSGAPERRSALVDMDGNIVKTWPFGGFPVKMLPDGSIIGVKRFRTGKNPLQKDPGTENKPTGTGPHNPPWQDGIEMIQVGWDGREMWSFSNWDDHGTGLMMSRQHHDFQREGNPVGYYVPGMNFVEKGKTLILGHLNRVVPEICDKELSDDVIYEVDWEGNLTGFEWHGVTGFAAYGFDDTAKESIRQGINYNEKKESFDWIHINSASYLGPNRWFDQNQDPRFHPDNIIISARSANFIAIISRETKKIVWKAGPDFVEGSPEHSLGQFVGQHHAHMIPKGLPGAGNIIVFDNGGQSGYGGPDQYPRYRREWSRVLEFNPVTFEIVWEYGQPSGEDFFFSHFISGMQRLPNGNTMITDGANGRVIEVSEAKQVLWEYCIPKKWDLGDRIYRAYRIPPDWVPENPKGYPLWATLYE